MTTDRERKLIQYDAAAQSLDFALDQLCQLSKQMDVMVAYWLEMSGVLDYILKHANKLQDDVLLQERIKNLKGEWAQVQTSCLQYQLEVRLVVSLLTESHCHLPVGKVARLQPHIQIYDYC
jgi:hypothetical protein